MQIPSSLPTNSQLAHRRRLLKRSIGEEILNLREDMGLSRRRLAAAAGFDPAHLCRIEAGEVVASVHVLDAIAGALGGRLRVSVYPGTGTPLRDHLQARMMDALLACLHPRWIPHIEVAVWRRARGFIDAVLVERVAPTIAGRAPNGPMSHGAVIATEAHSQLRRFEQQVGWAKEKAASLPSADVWNSLTDEPPEISRLLLLRSTAATRAVARDFSQLVGSAYPARSRDLFAAITSDSAWPGPGILWVRLEGTTAVLLDGPPRGVTLGR